MEEMPEVLTYFKGELAGLPFEFGTENEGVSV